MGASMEEREAELAAGRALLKAARGGAGGVLMVDGPAGIGKTSVLEAIVGDAAGMRVLKASGDELERGFAFGLARQLFERTLAHDAHLSGAALAGPAAAAATLLGTADSAPGISPESARHALTWLAANLADVQPLLLVLDDLQWADPASLAWVAHLARRSAELPVAVLAAWRTGEPGADEATRDRLRAEPATAITELAPLTPEAVAAVVRRWDASAGEALCAACARASGGNPFLLDELLRELPSAEADAVEAVHPASIGRNVARRLGSLVEGAVRAAEACAVFGDGCELRHVESLAGLGRAEAVAAVDDLAGAAILAPGRPLRFLHPLVRRAVYEAVRPHRRAQLHADAARILAGEGADLLQMAGHIVAAPPAGDPWACEVLTAAARRALASGAPAEAAELLERALAEPPPASARTGLLLELGRAELRMHRPQARERLEQVVAESGDARERARALIELAYRAPFPLEATELDRLERTRAELGDADRELSLQLSAAAVSSIVVGRGAREATVTLGADDLAGETPAERLLLSALSYDLFLRGTHTGDSVATYAERALADGRLAEEHPEALGPAATVMALFYLDRVDAADRGVAAGLAAARTGGSEIAFASWSLVECYGGYLRGTLLEAEAAGRSALAAMGPLAAAHPGVAAYLGLVLIDRGALDEAEALLAAAPSAPLQPGVIDALARRSLMRLRAAQGRWADALAEALGVGEMLGRHGASAHPAAPWRAEAAVACSVLGRPDEARELLAAQWDVARHVDIPRLTAATLRADGIVTGGEAGIALIEQAVAVLERLPARLESARTLLELGALQRRIGRRKDARETLRRALDLSDRSSAGLLAQRARDELAASGARLRRRELSGVEALTPSELRVARLAAEGLTNREIAQSLFVTVKTVEAQLGAVYRKTDGRRAELPGLLAGTVA